MCVCAVSQVWDEDVPERPVHEIQYENRPALNAIVGAPVAGRHFAVAGANGFVSIHRSFISALSQLFL